MNATNDNPKVVLIRVHVLIGGGGYFLKVFHIDHLGEENLILEFTYSDRPNWLDGLQPIIQDSLEARISKVIVDLTNLVWVNSTGLHILIALHQGIVECGCEVLFANPSPRVSLTFEVTQLSNVFVISGTIDEAIEKCLQ